VFVEMSGLEGGGKWEGLGGLDEGSEACSGVFGGSEPKMKEVDVGQNLSK
jgi:hypothetical protein